MENKHPATPEFEEAARQMRNGVYAASVKVYEGCEHRGLMRGNGHHAAQKLAESAVDDLSERWWRLGDLLVGAWADFAQNEVAVTGGANMRRADADAFVQKVLKLVEEEAAKKEQAPARSVPEVLAEVGVLPELIPAAEEKLREAGLLSSRAKAPVKREVEHNG